LGFDWGGPDIPAAGRDGWWNERHDRDRGWDTYAGKPPPPWPPPHVSGASFTCCLSCPHKRPRCADCPADTWEGRAHDDPSDIRQPAPGFWRRIKRFFTS